MSFPLVVFEGIDGSGKTTLRNNVWNRLLMADVPTIAMGQHSWLDVDLGRQLSELRRASGPDLPSSRFTDVREAYLEDKKLHWEFTIAPALEHAVVILDRYFLSDAVYLDALYGIPAKETLREVSRRQLGTPQVLVFLDIDEHAAERRIVERGRESKHYERAAPLARVRRGYSEALEAVDGETRLFSEKLIQTSSRDKHEATAAAESVVAEVFASIAGASSDAR